MKQPTPELITGLLQSEKEAMKAMLPCCKCGCERDNYDYHRIRHNLLCEILGIPKHDPEIEYCESTE